jgi:hypothetical protein
VRTKSLIAIAVLAVAASTAVVPASASAASGTTRPSTSPSCAKFSGTVVLTYSNPDTIVLHIIKGKVNAATVFTMTPTTTYTRNGAPSSFSAIKLGDVGTIAAQPQYPSGTLLACSVTVTGA